MPLRYVVLDFDGTCTQVEAVHQGFLDTYRDLLKLDAGDWKAACEAVAAASPRAGWTLRDAPSTAPAAADPYILAGEAFNYLQRLNPKLPNPPPDHFGRAYGANVAPFRPELGEVLADLDGRGLHIGFISNSDSAAVAGRITDLLHGNPKLRERIFVSGNASKFAIKELPFDSKNPRRAKFEQLPAALSVDGLGRPVYLRRGSYFEALCRLWDHFDEKGYPVAETLVCGDIWELDLAMPAELGTDTHLIERAAPYQTCEYEIARTEHVSADLHGLLVRV